MTFLFPLFLLLLLSRHFSTITTTSRVAVFVCVCASLNLDQNPCKHGRETGPEEERL